MAPGHCMKKPATAASAKTAAGPAKKDAKKAAGPGSDMRNLTPEQEAEAIENCRSDGARKMLAWAFAVHKGESPAKPGITAQYIRDELTKLDRHEGGDAHLKHYQSLPSHKAKQDVALKLVLDKTGYTKDFKVFNSNFLNNQKKVKLTEGWFTWWQIADLESIPHGPDREEMTMELITERDSKERAHESSKWAARGIKEYYWIHGGNQMEREHTRNRSSGYSCQVDIDDPNHQNEQDKLLNDAMDASFDKKKNLVGLTIWRLKTTHRPKQIKRKRVWQNAAKKKRSRVTLIDLCHT